MRKRAPRAWILGAVVATLVGVAPAAAQAPQTPKKGGVFRVGMLWEQQTRLFYEKVPVTAYGDLSGLRAARKTVKGFDDKTDRPRFYNVWLDK